MVFERSNTNHYISATLTGTLKMRLFKNTDNVPLNNLGVHFAVKGNIGSRPVVHWYSVISGRNQ